VVVAATVEVGVAVLLLAMMLELVAVVVGAATLLVVATMLEEVISTEVGETSSEAEPPVQATYSVWQL